MSKEDLGPASQSLEEVLIKRVQRDEKPNIQFTDHVVLKDGPSAYKVATRHVLVDHNTGEIHHNSIKIETYRHKPGGWIFDTGNSINLSDEHSNEIGALLGFLQVVVGDSLPNSAGDFMVLPVGDALTADTVRSLLDAAPNIQQVTLLTDLINRFHNNDDALSLMLHQLKRNPAAARHFTAALNVARYNEAIGKLTELIESNASEKLFQTHLAQNPWMFGSEYSELLDRRTWVRDSQKDFMLRRTVDGYLEIIEIKTTLDGDRLFLYDRSHDSYYPQAELSKVVGQVMHYIDLVDADQYRLLAVDQEHTARIRAKVIIGRDINDEQIAALKAYNGFLNRIEIMTFDQLAKTAHQVVAYLEKELPHEEDDDDEVPF